MLDSTLEMPDLIVMDVLMPHLSGLGVLTALQGAGLETPVIMMTGFAHSSVVERAKRLGATTVLQKPFDVDDLRSAVFACTRRDSGTHAARRAFG